MNQQLELFYLHLNDAVITTNDFEEGTLYRSKILQFTDETATQRMQAGAEYTNRIRKETALAVLRKAHQELVPIYGAKLTPRILSLHTKQNIKTVRKYLPHI